MDDYVGELGILGEPMSQSPENPPSRAKCSKMKKTLAGNHMLVKAIVNALKQHEA